LINNEITFYVPPNTIDFSTVFTKFNLTDNAAVFSTMICLVVVYLLICVWALRQDKKDIDRGQHNDQKKMNKRTNNDLQNTKQKTMYINQLDVRVRG
jgi:Ca2+/H+ antiporter